MRGKSYDDIVFDTEVAARYAFIDCIKQLRIGNDDAVIPYLNRLLRGTHDALVEIRTVDAGKLDLKTLQNLNQLLNTIIQLRQTGDPSGTE